MRALLASSLLLAAAVQAQSPALLAYKRTPGDTLHYRMSSKTMTESNGPQGASSGQTTRTSALTLAVGGADSVRAWYDSIGGMMASAQGQRPIAMDWLVGRVFTMRVDERGAGTLLEAPQTAGNGAGDGTSAGAGRGGDMRGQFENLLPKLPARELRVGDSWADTVNSKTKQGLSSRQVNSVRVSRVTRDTVIDGRRVVFIEQKQHVKTTEEFERGGQPYRNTMEGDVVGTIQFAPDEGHLLRYSSHSDTRGKTTTPRGDADEHQVNDYLIFLRKG